MESPDRKLYSLYTTFDSGRNAWVLKNGNHLIMYSHTEKSVFDEEVKFISNKYWEKYLDLNDKYLTFCRHNPEPAPDNWIETALRNGFNSYKLGFNPQIPQFNLIKHRIKTNCNWFGISVYEPDWKFIREKDEKQIIASLNGIFSELKEIKDKDGNIKDTCQPKFYISFYEKNKKVYEIMDCMIPDENILNEFIK